MIKRATCTGMAVIVSAVMLLSGSGGSFAYAASEDASYEFDYAKSATAQLDDLFTTIDIMDATAAGLSDEMEKGNVTSEQLVQMYIDRIQAYVKAYTVKNGKKKYIKTSPLTHAYTSGASKKYSNAKALTVNKTKVTLKKGKTFKIRTKITAKGKGTCTVVAFAHNGVSKKIKVTVK